VGGCLSGCVLDNTVCFLQSGGVVAKGHKRGYEVYKDFGVEVVDLLPY